MTTKMKWVLGLCLAALLGLVACRNTEVREDDSEVRYVRIIDVEEPRFGTWVEEDHYVRTGVLKFAAGFKQGHLQGSRDVPFRNHMQQIEEETGINIDYVMLSDWDEVRKEVEKAQAEKVTAIVLFNNSYDGSLIREANSGYYADMEPALTEFGFYDKTAYNQTVLRSGMLEKGQTLVPILYNVPGMIQGDMGTYAYEDWKELAYGHAENAELDFGSFLERLKDSMKTSNVEGMEVPFLSPAFLEGKVDLYLTASGADLESCQNQEELFTLLYNYLKCYDETQVKTKGDGVSNQMLYAQYIDRYNEFPEQYIDKNTEKHKSYTVPEKMAEKLKIEDWSPDMSLYHLAETTLQKTDYFVECSSAEDIAFHSIFGTLAYRNFYMLYRKPGFDKMGFNTPGNMNYWPIGIMNSSTEYAAQPICYAAVVDGSSTRLAAEVLQSMMKQPVDAKFGISVCNESKDTQLETWKTNYTETNYGLIRGGEGGGEKPYWEYVLMRSSVFIEDKEIYTNQVAKQIDNIVVARIPDREVLAIWQDTLTEAVDSGLSAEAGFKLLCERIEKRNIEE